MIKKAIKVLVVDDSLVFREVFARKLSADIDIEVVGKANDVYQARDMILQYRPDVVTLDVEMPKMNGIEFLKRLMPQYPLPVIVVSAVNDKVFDALNAGAVEFVTKPDMSTNIDVFIEELISKIKIAAKAKIGMHKKAVKKHGNISKDIKDVSDLVIAIGASTGGTNALYELIKVLPENIPGILIVQHMPPVFTKLYAERLNKNFIFDIKEAENRDEVLPGRILIAPGGYHMRLKKSGRRMYVETEAETESNKVSGHCPSVDVLFHSVAKYAGSKAIGVILTGMGKDGANGLLEMKRAGADTIGQDEETAVVYGMPKVAYEIGAVDQQLALQKIPKGILELLQREKS